MDDASPPDFKLVASGSKEAAQTLWQHLNELDPAGATATTIFPNPDDTDLWDVELYFSETCPDANQVTTEIGAVANGLSWHRTAIPAENWVEKVQRDLAPVEAGRFLIHGSHDRDVAANHPSAIEVDAGEAFGTAHHATTTGCLRAISDLIDPDRHSTCLDLGTGTGVLAMAMARALPPEATIIASDIDATSVVVAKENATRNGLTDRIAFLKADGVQDAQIEANAPFDFLVANILAEPLVTLAPEIARLVDKRAIIVLSGLLITQADTVKDAYRNAGLAVQSAYEIGEWATLVLAAPETNKT